MAVPWLQAIAALQKAHAANPSNAEVLLALGVSYVNELDQGRALEFLHSWLRQHPSHGAAASAVPPVDDSSQALTHAIQCFQQAAFQVCSGFQFQLMVSLACLQTFANGY